MLKEVERQIGDEYFVKKLKGSGCRVYFDKIQEDKLIFDVERFCKIQKIDKKRCDFAVFLKNPNGQFCCILVELKSGALKASAVFDQLKGGAVLIEENFADFDFKLIPLVLVGNAVTLEIESLKKARVLFRGIKHGIALGKCNRKGNLNSAIGDIFRAH